MPSVHRIRAAFSAASLAKHESAYKELIWHSQNLISNGGANKIAAQSLHADPTNMDHSSKDMAPRNSMDKDNCAALRLQLAEALVFDSCRSKCAEESVRVSPAASGSITAHLGILIRRQRKCLNDIFEITEVVKGSVTVAKNFNMGGRVANIFSVGFDSSAWS